MKLFEREHYFIIAFVIILDRQFQLFQTVDPLNVFYWSCLVDLTLLTTDLPLLVHMHRSLRSSSKAFISIFVTV